MVGRWRYVANVARHVAVSMFVYIETASYVARRVFGGRSRVFKNYLSAKESLKYEGWA